MNAIRNIWVRAALVVSLLVPVYFLVAAFGTKFGLFDWRIGFGLMTYQLAAKVLMGAAAFALVGFVLAILIPPRTGWAMALIALVIPAAGLGYGLYVQKTAGAVPPIHDISTDLQDPPSFSQAVVDARAQVKCGNGLDLLTARVGEFPDASCAFGPPGPPVLELHRAAYGDLHSIDMPMPPNAAFDKALAAARAQGWSIGREDRAEGQIEATSRSFWYGFTDDIAVRVRPHDAGSIVDVRSVSRVGVSDMGVNARRIRAFAAALHA